MTDNSDDDRCHWGLYVILEAQCAGRSHSEIAREALAGGARVLQLRDKTAPFERLMEIGTELRQLTRDAGAALIVNDNPYLARELQADGVHVGQGDMHPVIVRDIVGPEMIIGLSTHTHQQVLDARKEPVDYIGVGPVYPTASKQSEWPAVGPDLVQWVKSMISLPVVAIGGITLERVPDVVAAGADNVAVIREIMSAPDIAGRTREMREAIERSRP